MNLLDMCKGEPVTLTLLKDVLILLCYYIIFWFIFIWCGLAWPYGHTHYISKC